MMDYTAPLKQQGHRNLPDILSSDPQRPTFLLQNGCMSQINYRAQSERNGVSGHLFLTQTRQDEQTFDTRTILLHPGWVLMKGSDGAEQPFTLITTNKVVKGRNQELLKVKVRNRRIRGFSHEVRKKGEGTGTPTARVTNKKGKAVQLTNPLGQCKSK